MEWSLGHYEVIGEQLLPSAEVVVERAAPADGDRVVDLGCGTGNAALLAAERGARVTGVDPAQRLLDVAAARAAEGDLDIAFRLGDGASIPMPDESADIMLSVFGVIFAPSPEAAAVEIARVTGREGRIVLSAWIPEGAISEGVRISRETIAAIKNQPPGPPPFAWHEDHALGELFGPHGFTVSTEEHSLAFSAPSAREFVETEQENHPLAIAARPALEKSRQVEALRDRLVEHYEAANEAPSSFRVTSRYVVAELRR